MEKYDGHWIFFDQSQKQPKLFPPWTHYDIVNVGTKSHQIETDSYFLNFIFGVAFFRNRESFIKMFTQSAYVSFFVSLYFVCFVHF